MAETLAWEVNQCVKCIECNAMSVNTQNTPEVDVVVYHREDICCDCI